MDSSAVYTVTLKTVMDVSDAKHNIEALQSSFKKLKLPDKIGDNLKNSISGFLKEYDKYQAKISQGIKTQGDQNAVNKSLNSMQNYYSKIVSEFSKLSSKDFKEIFNLDEGAFKNIQNRIKEIEAELKKVKLDPNQLIGPLEKFKELTSAKSLFGSGTGFDKIKFGFEQNDLIKAKEGLAEVDKYLARFGSQIKPEKFKEMQAILEPIRAQITTADSAAQKFAGDLDKAERELIELGAAGTKGLKGVTSGLDKSKAEVESLTASLKKQHAEEFGFNREVQNIDRQIQSYFGLSQMIRKVGQIAKDAFRTVKELDKAMTETAVVTNFSVGDMWNMLPMYTEQANQLGSTIKDVYEAATLYYQQGLNTNQAMGLANETLKMARIGGLQAAEATDMMTAALRGFNMEINQTSAQKINDVYSQLAAITASNTKEIGSAMERTASIANSANMDFATTSAFLAQMIETTREAPENLGTAMKTIVARFQEMKKDPTQLVDSEGVAMDVNKVDAALKSIGVALTNTKGEFRDLDDVFLDISARWDSLTQGQQRYIATIAAGSRQQSRFIAMMSNYDRTMELVDAANNSAGASQKQFEKTLESMSTKLNKLKNAWDQFTMGLMNNEILKGGVDSLTLVFTTLNKIIDVLGKIPPSPFEGITKSALTLASTLLMLNVGKKVARGGVMAGVGWWKGEGTLREKFKEGYGKSIFSRREKPVAQEPIDTTTVEQQAQKQLEQKLAKRTTITRMPVKLQAVTESVDTAMIGPKAKEALRARIIELENEINSGNLTKVDAKIKFEEELRSQGWHESTVKQLSAGFDKGGEEAINTAGVAAPKIEKLTQNVTSLGTSLTTTGMALTKFGNNLGGPFGSAVATAGTLLTSLGTTLQSIGIAFLDNYKKALIASVGEKAAAAGTYGFSASLKALRVALLGTLGPLALIAAAIAILVIAYKAWDAAHENDKERLERMSNAAAKASEAYSSLKQETSELNDSIEQIRTNEDAFDSLVAGTAEFNEQLVEANNKILELIDKFPMLADPKYLSTDKNGLMHISEEGLELAQKEQKRRQGNAAALSVLQNSQLKAEQNRQKSKDYAKQALTAQKEDADDLKRKSQYYNDIADAQEKVAQQTAITSALSGEELKNGEKLSAIYSSQYQDLVNQVDVENASIDQKRQAYADFYGYTYNKSKKEIVDNQGNVVIDKDSDDVIEDAYADIIVMADLQVNAASLDKMVDVIDSKFTESLGNAFEDSGNLLTDILSDNIDTNEDALRALLQDPGKITEGIKNLNEKQIAALLNISEEDVAVDPEKFRKRLETKVKTEAQNIADAQTKSYEDLGGMMAQAYYGSIEYFEKYTSGTAIASQIEMLKAEQAHTISNIGALLRDNVGSEAMSEFIKDATDIYLHESEETIKEFDDIINEINWESPTSRLEGYNKAIDSSNKRIQEWGNSMRNAADEANILGEAFDEFVGGDWLDLAENADNFKNSLGEIDAAGILKIADSSKTLKTLLDSGEVSATGLAMALQGIEEGKYSIGAVNETVLLLLSNMNKLYDVALEAHNIIENFDPGIDTGEGDNFVKENAEAAKEYYENQKYGNEQLINYIKLAAGTERWDEAYRKSHGNLKKTEKLLENYFTTFENGFHDAWQQLIDGNSIDGKTLLENINSAEIEDELKEKFKKVNFSIDENGDLKTEIGELTTSELETYFKEIYGVSEEYAKLFMQDLANYDETIAYRLKGNDLQSLISSGELQTKRGTKNLILTDEELKILEDANVNIEELAEAAGTTKEELEKTSFKVLEGDERRSGLSGTLLRDYAETFKTNKHSIKSLFGLEEFQSGGTFDLKKLMTETSKVMDEQQTLESAYRAWQIANKEGQETSYEGQKLDLDKNATIDEFAEAISAVTEKSQWYEVGQSIAEGIISYIESRNQRQQEQRQEPLRPTDTGTAPNAHETKTTPTYGKGQADPSKDGPSSGRGSTRSSSKTDISYNPGYTTTYNPPDITPTKDQTKGYEKTKETIENGGNIVTNALKNFGEKTVDEAKQSEQKWDSFNPKAGTEKTEEAVKEANDAIIDSYEKGADSVNTDGLGAAAEKNAEEVANEYVNGYINYRPTAPGVAPNAHEAQGEKGTGSQIPTQVSSTVTVDTGDSEEKIQTIINKLGELPAQKNTAVTITQNYEVKGKKVKAKDQDASINYNKIKYQIPPETKNADVKYDKVAYQAPPVKKDAPVHYYWDGVMPGGPSKVSIPVEFSGTKKFTVTTSNAKGKNNIIPNVSLPSLGSLAKGTKYGRLGPKGKGGLTLTGEEGFEIAWLPSESKSMILGANGPQMINLPSDAVVYTHEQSKKILKQKSILGGSHARPMEDVDSDGSGGGGGGKPQKSKSKSKSNDDKKEQKDQSKKVTKIIEKAGKINAYWWNMTKKVDATQRKIDDFSKKIEKLLKQGGTTLKSISDITNKYIKALNQQVDLNKNMRDKARNQLSVLNTGKTSAKDKAEQDAAKKEVKAAKAKLKAAKKTKGESDDKKAKTALKEAKKKLKKAQKGANWEDISYDVTKKVTTTNKKGKKTTKKEKVTKKQRIDLSPYVKYDKETGAYIVDASKINNKFGKNSSKAKAVNEAAQKKVDDLTSKRNTAEDNINKAQEALDQLGQNLYETFMAWENNLTEIYELTKKIEALTAKLSVKDAYQEFLDARFEVFGTNNTDRLNLDYFSESMETFREKITLSGQKIAETSNLISESRKNLNGVATGYKNIEKNIALAEDKLSQGGLSEEQELYYKTIKEENERAKKVLENGKEKGYYKTVKNDDGTYTVTVNEKAIEKAKAAGELSATDAEYIYQYVEDVAEANSEYLENITDALGAVTELYQELGDLQKEWVEMNKDLREMLEEQEQEKIDQAKELSDAISNSMKDLLNKVKKVLDERRRKEDNQKTVDDITRKQQRLAMLRADTAGGHAVEIAQLEKEIADAQQSYQRTLEDQMLDKLQDQADEAAEQREEMISLMEAQLNLTNFGQQVDKWMKNPERYAKEIKDLWYNSNYADYDKLSKAEKDAADDEWNKWWADLTSNQEKQQEIIDEIKNTKDAIVEAINAGDNIADENPSGNGSGNGSGNKGGSSSSGSTTPKTSNERVTGAAALRNKGKTLDEVRNTKGYGKLTAQEALKAGFSEKEVAKSFGTKRTIKAINKSGQGNVNKLNGKEYGKVDVNGKEKGGKISDSHVGVHSYKDKNGKEQTKLKITANDGSTLYVADIDPKTGEISGNWRAIPISQLTQQQVKEYVDAKQALKHAIQYQGTGSKINKNFKALAKEAGLLNKKIQIKKGSKNPTYATIGNDGKIYYDVEDNVKIWDPAAGDLKVDKYDTKKFTKWAKKQTAVAVEYDRARNWHQKKYGKFVSGGLADYTGPAWLDGTPAKPELVLNAADTKNFLTLKDVLSKAISSTSANESYGNASYEININVDHLNSDYDVDKVAARVKKIIVNDSSYRNVTQVRNIK